MTRETYNWAVDTLLDAYNEGKLKHGDCAACAVGSLLNTPVWSYDFQTAYGEQYQTNDIHPDIREELGICNYYKDFLSKKEVSKIRNFLDNLYKKHGFTGTELSQIEYSFETSLGNEKEYDSLYKTKEGQFIGLTAVLKLMSTMVTEDTISEETINSNQERLVKVFEKVNI